MNLKEKMLANKCTARELSQKSKISTGSIFKYRTGERTPSVKTAKALAKALDCTIDDLFKEES